MKCVENDVLRMRGLHEVARVLKLVDQNTPCLEQRGTANERAAWQGGIVKGLLSQRAVTIVAPAREF